ncbi:hypothetical protein CR513_10916, partial [Mucuna pruriens]
MEGSSNTPLKNGSHLNQQDQAESALVAVVGGNGNPHPKPLIIHYNLASQPRVPLIIEVLARPTYKDSHAIPWRYPAGEEAPLSIDKENPVSEVTNIAGIGGMTRSGRIFAPKGCE